MKSLVISSSKSSEILNIFKSFSRLSTNPVLKLSREKKIMENICLCIKQELDIPTYHKIKPRFPFTLSNGKQQKKLL